MANRYFGPSVLDRTHQLSFGGYADLPAGFQLNLPNWLPINAAGFHRYLCHIELL
jgi:hypothetical protein